MGSSGMKRKGRRHLPKVGTRQADEHELHDRRELAMHPMSADPLEARSGVGRYVTGALVVLLVVVGVVAFAIAT